MNWRHETWRKLYVREEGSFAALSFWARSLAAMLLKLCDDRGRIFGRQGERVEEAICFRLGADRGQRRIIRAAIKELVGDGYLIESDGHLRIRNFARAHGTGVDVEEAGIRIDPVQVDPAAVRQPSDNDPAIIRPPSDHQRATVVQPSDHHPATVVQSPGIEDGPKRAESQGSGGDVPSVPFLPSVPSVPVKPHPEGGQAPAIDYPEGESDYRSRLRRGFDTQRLLDTFGRIQAQVRPGCVDWNAAGQGLWETASQTARYLESHPDAVPDVEPTMRTVLMGARESQDPKDHKANVLFGRWASSFSDLRNDLRGLGPGAGGKPCAFHSGGRNTGSLPRKEHIRRECPECKHLYARAGPRGESAPESTAEIWETPTGR